jgi:hypothetical protein
MVLDIVADAWTLHAGDGDRMRRLQTIQELARTITASVAAEIDALRAAAVEHVRIEDTALELASALDGNHGECLVDENAPATATNHHRGS